MKIYVITAKSWNGEHDVTGVVGRAFFDEEKANAWVQEMNAKRQSAYWDEYDYEEVEVE
jgi:hypothetical protein